MHFKLWNVHPTVNARAVDEVPESQRHKHGSGCAHRVTKPQAMLCAGVWC